MIKIVKIIVVTLAVVWLAGCIIHVNGKDGVAGIRGAWAQEPEVTLTKSLSMDAASLTTLRVEVGAGELIIEGSDNIDQIEVSALIKTTEEQDYEFSLEQNGSTAILIAQHRNQYGNSYNSVRLIDVQIKLPSNLKLDVEDRSGDLVISNIKNDLFLKDSSGDVSIRSISGKVEVSDRSGNLSLIEVGGDVWLEDTSGDVSISSVNGEVKVADRSGDIEILDVDGKVTVSDTSGDIKVKQAGSVEIVEDSSGDTDISDIVGTVILES